MAGILVLHGPNLNLLGTREPEVYGYTTLADIDAKLKFEAADAGHKLASFQSNAEHALIDRVHQARETEDFIIINPGAFSHTSIALRDAITGVNLPCIEVHISNVYARETFRQKSYFSDIAVALISGCGADGYSYALTHAIKVLEKAE